MAYADIMAFNREFPSLPLSRLPTTAHLEQVYSTRYTSAQSPAAPPAQDLLSWRAQAGSGRVLGYGEHGHGMTAAPNDALY